MLSGGIDSTACVAFYLNEGFLVRGLFIDYGQISAHREEVAANAIANHYGISLSRLTWIGENKKDDGFIVGRNAFLLLAALMELPDSCGILAMGVHEGSHFVDCSPSFIQHMQSLLDLYTDGKIQIGTPFLEWSKIEI